MADVLERLRRALAGRYRVDRELGRGGMATVFLGEDLKHRRPVAIKVLDPELSAILGAERFRQEIELAAKLQHPHILTLLDSGAGEGLLYYVMPYIEGESLRARLDRERTLGLEEAVRLAEEAGRALDFAHRQGIVHRDIKPENILLADGQAMLADFGIARAIRVAGGEGLTRSGVTLGTPPYMSPEQIAGERDLDGRSDLYSLGCVLYEMLAGQPPFTGPAESLSHQHLNVTPRPVSELRPAVPPALDGVMRRLLAKTPGDRFTSAAQLVEALRATTSSGATSAAASPPASATGPRPAPVRGGARRGWIPIVAALAVLAAAVALWRSGALERVTGRRAGAPPERQWVWLAAFEGPAEDPTLAATARDLVGAALDRSERVATVPAEQVRIALRNAGRPDTARIDASLARELAYRSSIPVVVEGRIGRLGAAYSIVLRATSASDGHVILTADGTAADERALVPTLTRLARDLRRGLGERPEDFRLTQTVADSPTPSFEAFKLYTRGRGHINASEPLSAVRVLRDAIALDPEFAAAWGALGTALGNMGRVDSALTAYREALRHSDRLTEARRLDIVAKIASILGDSRAVIDAYDAMLKLNPTPGEAAVALNNLAGELMGLGRYEQALEMYRRASATWPVAPPPLSDLNLASVLTALRRDDEAWAIARRMPDPLGPMTQLDLAHLERRWELADSLAIGLAADPTHGLFPRVLGSSAHASAMALRGQMGAASRELQHAEHMGVEVDDHQMSSMIWMERAWLAQVTDAAPVPPSVAALTGFPGGSTRGLAAAMRGDSTSARRAIESWKPEAPPELRAAFTGHIEGWLAWHRREWPRVLDDLRENARGGLRDGIPPVEAMRMPARWLMADAFEHLGQADSAVAYLGLMLDPPGNSTFVLMMRNLSEPLIRVRLVTLNVALGRLDEARRQWNVLAETTTRPDPELVATLDETRAALRSAEALRAGSGR